jgi:hypothetical protein
MDLYGNESTERNSRKFLVGMNLVAVAMAGGRRTYGYGAARKEPSGETAVQGAVRGSGESSQVLRTSPARQGCEGEIAAAAVAQMEVFGVGNERRRRETPAPLFIVLSGN